VGKVTKTISGVQIGHRSYICSFLHIYDVTLYITRYSSTVHTENTTKQNGFYRIRFNWNWLFNSCIFTEIWL